MSGPAPRRAAALAAARLLAAGAAEAATRYFAFGDSITRGSTWPLTVAGQVVVFDEAGGPDCTSGGDHCGYAWRLEDALQGAGIDAEVLNRGIGAENTAGGISRVESVLAEGGDVLLLMEGTNDIFDGISPETTKFNLGVITDKATAAGVDTVLVTVNRKINDPQHQHTLALRNNALALATEKNRAAADPWLVLCPNQACYNAHYYQPDQTVGHPDASGYDILSDVIRDRITVEPVLGAPTPVSPTGTTHPNVSLVWAPEDGATWYRVSLDGPGGNLFDRWYEAAAVCASDCRVTPDPPLDGGSHSWRVLARNLAGNGPWSADTAFLVEEVGALWQPFFAVDPRETPAVGDFDGDGKTDIVTFTRDNPLAIGDVYVALSDGSQFGTPNKWNDFFAIDSGEKVIVGDYDGDGDDDIATWLGPERALGATFEIYVALSFGTGMCQSSLWLSSLGNSIEDQIFAGDVDMDGDDDLILFDRSAVNGFGKVRVARSNGMAGVCDESGDPSPGSFQAPTEWHGFFAVSSFERPLVGDLDGDGCTDIITFATDSPTAFGDVYVAKSNCTDKFVDQDGTPNNSTKWHDFFGINPAELLRIGDFGGDTFDDFFTFLPQTGGEVYVSESGGTAMGPNVLYVPGGLAPGPTSRLFVGDATGEGRADIIHFQQWKGTVRVLPTP